MKAEFTEFDNSTNWVEGTVGDYVFQAKLFDNGSIFGIDNGRVSKLAIWPKNENFSKRIVGYDRGWDIKPNSKNKNIFDAVMDLLENSPKRF